MDALRLKSTDAASRLRGGSQLRPTPPQSPAPPNKALRLRNAALRGGAQLRFPTTASSILSSVRSDFESVIGLANPVESWFEALAQSKSLIPPMTYERKLPSELPLGSYPRDPVDPDQKEMAVYGRGLDGVELENKQLLEGIASPVYAPEWMVSRYERLYQLSPLPADSLADRQAGIIAAMGLRRNLSVASFQKIANGFLGYSPIIVTSPHPFHCGQSTFASGHKLVEDWIKFAFWIELDATKTAKPYDSTNLVAALLAAAPAEVIQVWTYWGDEAFDWNAYNPA